MISQQIKVKCKEINREMASSAAVVGDKYRDYLSEEDIKNTTWRFGPPNYDDVNKLFEEGRTHVLCNFI